MTVTQAINILEGDLPVGDDFEDVNEVTTAIQVLMCAVKSLKHENDRLKEDSGL